MKYIAILTLLAGCANIQDNTTIGDKLIIGGTFVVMGYLANKMVLE